MKAYTVFGGISPQILNIVTT